MRREFSAGGVVYRFRNAHDPEFLLIRDAWGRWTLPKGLIEKGEKPLQAALREVREETGIQVAPAGDLDRIHYFYRDPAGELVYKTVYYFLMEAAGGAVSPQLEEISDARWVAASQAVEKCGYEDTRPVLEKALARVTQSGLQT
ncbi:MAG: NUDIX domain-containing protein [Bacillota bacterium]|jgi:8-oxo-dGTP pyrophosphatase MutT (NUDIX family)|nr:NUDIX domain-containing protein [Bacillota bacterium]